MTGKYTIGFSAVGQIKRSDFGMDSYIPIVGDQIDLEVYAEFLNVGKQ
jgi:polyisoprenoid-binding protein YceI